MSNALPSSRPVDSGCRDLDVMNSDLGILFSLNFAMPDINAGQCLHKTVREEAASPPLSWQYPVTACHLDQSIIITGKVL